MPPSRSGGRVLASASPDDPMPAGRASPAFSLPKAQDDRSDSSSASARLILASTSPRRFDLLQQIGLVPDAVVAPAIDETPERDEPPRRYAERMAAAKALAGRAKDAAGFVVAADTVVAVGRRVLPKAEAADQARGCLELLSGRRHWVHGGLCVVAPDGTSRTRLVSTHVTFKRLHDDEIDAYLATGEWRGKAGGYAIQGRGAVFVKAINGSYTNVVGLSLYDANNMLRGLGYRR